MSSALVHSCLKVVQQLGSLVFPTVPLSTISHIKHVSTGLAAPLASVDPSGIWMMAPKEFYGMQLVSTLFATREKLFELEPLITASAIFFCRLVVVTGVFSRGKTISDKADCKSNTWELMLRTLFAILLGGMAFVGMNYELLCALHLWSHMFPWAVSKYLQSQKNIMSTLLAKNKQNVTESSSLLTFMVIAFFTCFSFLFTLLLCRYFSNLAFIIDHIPSSMIDVIMYMFPIKEMIASYNIISAFYTTNEQKKVLYDMLKHLLFVTVHIQFGMGHIGIAFLTSEQQRKNILIRMDVDNVRDEERKPKDSNGTDGNDDNDDKDKQQGVNKRGGISQVAAANNKQVFDPSRKFRHSAPSFIFFCVLPYMIQIILFGNLNNFSFMYVRNQIHRSVRIDELFNHDSHLVALANDSATSPDVYASSMDKVFSTAYDIINRKLFSLPKLILLPGVISRQPSLLVKIFPYIFLTDLLKGRLVASVTNKVEEFQKEAQDVNSIRQKVEQFDMKHAELLRRSGVGATQFTQRRWDELTVKHQAKIAACDLLIRTRGFFMWLQRNFVFVALIDCALAKLLAEGSIVVAEIFVFSRAIEDVVDLLLIRSRSESELATLMTQVEKLKGLEDVWSRSKISYVLPCRVESELGSSDQSEGQYLEEPNNGIVINNLQYSRGTAEVSVEHLVIEPGIYAVTGANGSGKSTLFRLLMACETNERPISLHESIKLATPIHHWDLSESLILPKDTCKAPDEGCEVVETMKQDESNSEVKAEEIPVTSIVMPSSDIVEISQVFYWPLYSSPIDWIYQKHVMSDLNETERLACVRRVAEELLSLSFMQSQNNHKSEDDAVTTSESVSEDFAAIEQLMVTLQDEKEDWFSELSGGQKSKVELVRKVFLRDSCPKILLVDETMAPLDPISKSQAMSRLKQFCHNSVVLVIYHTDVSRGLNTEDDSVIKKSNLDCVPSNGFFDHNLHVENKQLIHRTVC